MAAPPLTHHEILALVEPFARRGRHVDLASSQRTERQVAFKPLDHPGTPALRETLRLDSLGTGSLRLTRTLTRADGLQATLQGSGSDAAELLQRIEAVDLKRHFIDGPGFAIARSYQFESFSGRGAPEPVLSRGVVQLDGLKLTFDVPAVKGVSAHLALEVAPGQTATVPEDLLAVIGWDWARLVPQTDGWTSRMRLRGAGAPRSHKAERALERAAQHLAGIWSEPPARFHERFVWARWGVVLRRLIPTFTAIGLIVGTLLLPKLSIGSDPGFWLALHYLPIAILGLAFTLQELPRFEIPPWPRRLRAPAWRQASTAQGDPCSATR